MESKTAIADLTILGGGLSGLTLALQCQQERPETKITIVEKRNHPVPEAAFKVGESSVEAGAHYFANVLGFKDHIQKHQLPKLGLRFFFPAGDNSRIELRRELGGKRFAPCPSYQIDRGRFENFLGETCRERGIEFCDGARVESIRLSRQKGGHEVDLIRDGEQQTVRSRWVVDASGRRAFLKRQLNLQKDSPHAANSAWFRFKKHIKIDEWCDDPKWQQGHEGKTGRWYSTNHLMGQGYWVWMIPLGSGSTSLGIVAADEFHSLSSYNSFDKALDWLKKNEPQVAAAIERNLEHLQDFRAIKHYATECKQVYSAQRWGITGEAGFFHDPFYSPGSDFIAFSNTFLTDLISRDLNGKGFKSRAFAYDRIFKKFYYGTLTAYQGQYRVFGNPTVMPVKVLWDYLVYWSITGFIFMQDRLCHQTMYLRNLRRLNRLGKLNHFMQSFFRQWHERTAQLDVGGRIDISQMPIVRQLNQQLKEDLDGREFFNRFESNVIQLETLGREIVEHSGIQVPFPFRPRTHSRVISNAFELAFAPSQKLCESSDHLENRDTAEAVTAGGM